MRREAAALGTRVMETEVIGLVPEEAVCGVRLRRRCSCPVFGGERVLEDRLRVQGAGSARCDLRAPATARRLERRHSRWGMPSKEPEDMVTSTSPVPRLVEGPAQHLGGVGAEGRRDARPGELGGQGAEVEPLLGGEAAEVEGGGEEHAVGLGEGGAVGVVEEGPAGGQAARLEEHHEPAAGVALAQGAQGLLDRRRVMGEVVDHRHAARRAAAPPGAA